MTELAGLRVLVVEDEGMVALLIEGMLEQLGCEVVASAASLDQAQAAAKQGEIDLALLDVNLNGQLVFPVAEVLSTRQVPFVFSTGYGLSGLPEAYKAHEVLNKPYGLDELERKIRLAMKW